jgi:hypothetical protein
MPRFYSDLCDAFVTFYHLIVHAYWSESYQNKLLRVFFRMPFIWVPIIFFVNATYRASYNFFSLGLGYSVFFWISAYVVCSSCFQIRRGGVLLYALLVCFICIIYIEVPLGR